MNPASAITSLDQVPALHKFIAKIHPNRKPHIFDFGAGKEGKIDAFMAEQGLSYAPFDPFNRPEYTNQNSLLVISSCDFILSANVLNVLEDEVLDTVIAQLSNLTKRTKKKEAYITVYHKSGLPTNRQVKGHFQRNEKPEWYEKRLAKHFKEVYLRGKILTCFN